MRRFREHLQRHLFPGIVIQLVQHISKTIRLFQAEFFFILPVTGIEFYFFQCRMLIYVVHILRIVKFNDRIFATLISRNLEGSVSGCQHAADRFSQYIVELAFFVQIRPHSIQILVVKFDTIEIRKNNVSIPVNDHLYNAAVNLPDASGCMCGPEPRLLHIPLCCFLKELLQFRTVSVIPDLVPDHILPEGMRLYDRYSFFARRYNPKQPGDKTLHSVHSLPLFAL